jgi:diadenosine tetraphosphate (Ap4A) HIT family hydrolase
MINSTLKKFNYPSSLIREYKNWYLLLRPEQVTFGSMVLVEKKSKKNLYKISKQSFIELKIISKNIESFFLKKLKFNKINYLILMMVDPHVHIHIIPRHKRKILFSKKTFIDYGYPKPPNLFKINIVGKNIYSELKNKLVRKFK